VRTPEAFKQWVLDQKAALKQASAPDLAQPRSAQVISNQPSPAP